ncbi:hypothetical protein EYF80_058983 [Liparis tanakae]|uniref:Uncharacterized protein n=1 Tax=Liparis tanakae TaxID=230148 RepID=A0A4Z2ER66_9TELE|nr:hypothetical protein EYF80_058983 [Liparis tanakae]
MLEKKEPFFLEQVEGNSFSSTLTEGRLHFILQKKERRAPEQRRDGPGGMLFLPAAAAAYLAVVQNLVDGFGNKEDFPTVTPDHEEEAVSSLHRQTQSAVNTGAWRDEERAITIIIITITIISIISIISITILKKRLSQRRGAAPSCFVSWSERHSPDRLCPSGATTALASLPTCSLFETPPSRVTRPAEGSSSPRSVFMCWTAMRRTVSLSSLRDMALQVGTREASSSMKLFILSRRRFSIWL